MARFAAYDTELKCQNCGHPGAFALQSGNFCSGCICTCIKCGNAFIKDLAQPEQTLCPDCRKKDNKKL